jgi:hypothetical protein
MADVRVRSSCLIDNKDIRWCAARQSAISPTMIVATDAECIPLSPTPQAPYSKPNPTALLTVLLTAFNALLIAC